MTTSRNDQNPRRTPQRDLSNATMRQLKQEFEQRQKSRPMPHSVAVAYRRLIAGSTGSTAR